MKNRFASGLSQPGGVRDLLVLAFPMIISTSCDGVMTFTDRLFLARVGSEQMNAAMGGGVTMQMLTFFFMGLAGYSTALVAQYFGAREFQNTSKAAFQAILITVFAWPVLLLMKPLAVWFFYYMQLPEAQIGYQVEYLNILAWGGLFSMLRYTLGCYFTGIGKTKIVMVATLVAMVTNVFLDYILIFGKLGFEPMGVRGAALATVAGGFLAMVLLFIAFLSRSNQKTFFVLQAFRFDRKIMKTLIHYGTPAGLEMFLNFLAFFIMTAIFQSEGIVSSTATTIMFNWDMVSFIPLLGIEIAVTSLVGRYMGAEQPEVAHRSAISGVKTGIFYSAIILVLFVFLPEVLVRVFHPDVWSADFEKAVPIAVRMIQIASLYVLVEAVVVALVGALRGAGDTHFTMVASVCAHWSFVPLIYVSLKVLHFSLSLSWFLLVVFYLLFSLVLVLRFRSGKWKKIRVIHS